MNYILHKLIKNVLSHHEDCVCQNEEKPYRDCKEDWLGYDEKQRIIEQDFNFIHQSSSSQKGFPILRDHLFALSELQPAPKSVLNQDKHITVHRGTKSRRPCRVGSRIKSFYSQPKPQVQTQLGLEWNHHQPLSQSQSQTFSTSSSPLDSEDSEGSESSDEAYMADSTDMELSISSSTKLNMSVNSAVESDLNSSLEPKVVTKPRPHLVCVSLDNSVLLH